MQICLSNLILTVLVVWIAGAAPLLGYGNPPLLARSEPADGAMGVPVDLEVIRLHFTQDMNTRSHTIWTSAKGELPPLVEGGASWIDARTFELTLLPLKPGKTYAVQLNSRQRLGFESASGEPLPVTTVVFTTSAAGASAPAPPAVGEPPRAAARPDISSPAGGGNRPVPAPPPAKAAPGGPTGPGTYLALYQEQSQGAFRMLIPKGWRAEGGMVGSGLGWNVVDLVESNIRFRVSSPDGQSYFGYYPRFYFQDPAVTAQSSMGMLRPQPGQVQSGCWLYPYMPIRQYLEVIVFGQLAAQEIQSPRFLGDVVPIPELKVLVPSVASHFQAGYADFVCTVRGVPSYGRIYTVLYNLQNMIWSTVFTAGWIAPQSRWREDGRLMEICLKTFQLDPQWAARAAAASAQRAQQYGDTLRYMNEIDRQITEHRSQTRSDIQEEFYKVITSQIETRDPQTGQETYLPAYRYAYTDGRGNYFLSDDPNQNPAHTNPEWRPLEVINRNDPNYRPNSER